jgi:hypothetical protein
MAWLKKGQIFKPNGGLPWSKTHAQIPLPMKLNEERLRIYFSTRDRKGCSQLTFIEVDINNPKKILYINEYPLLPLGRKGAFDDSGIMPSSWIRVGNEIYMYYVGWNPQVTNSYHLAAGLAISHDQGLSFKKYSEGPIFERDPIDPIWCTIPCVINEAGRYRAWYISCTDWKEVAGKSEPVYLVKHAESKDAIHWKKSGDICINYCYDGEAIGRPWVVKESGFYRMWYSTRGSQNYRYKGGQTYQLGYAESHNGINWTRRDHKTGMPNSLTGWDAQMNCYAAVYKHRNKTFILYNGNGFGREGFGYAVWDDEA